MAAKLLFLLCLSGCLVLMTMPVYGSPAPVYFEDGTTYSIDTVQAKSFGSRMAGMLVTFNYTYDGNSYSDVLQWAKRGSRWGVFEVNTDVNPKGKPIIRLVEAGNTHRGAWTLKVAKGVTLETVSIDGLPGNTVFDTTFGGEEGTLGSGKGKDAKVVSLFRKGAAVEFTYSDLAMLEGSAGAVGDLYRHLDMQFSGMQPVTSLVFKADTSVASASPVPLPPSLVLICSGLLFLFCARKARCADLKRI